MEVKREKGESPHCVTSGPISFRWYTCPLQSFSGAYGSLITFETFWILEFECGVWLETVSLSDDIIFCIGGIVFLWDPFLLFNWRTQWCSNLILQVISCFRVFRVFLCYAILCKFLIFFGYLVIFVGDVLLSYRIDDLTVKFC